MSRGQKRRDHRNFPKMKLRGRRYRDRMTGGEYWEDCIEEWQRAWRKSPPDFSLAQLADTLTRFGQAAMPPLYEAGPWFGAKVIDPDTTITTKPL